MNQNKWERYGSYEAWKDFAYSSLMKEYEKEKENNLNWSSGGVPSFDDFCMGKWQGLPSTE